ncbi:MAG: NADH:flavin oxidoreductase [Chloroflexi bacterium]|nr:NADH:flavin oxidoreductase [Chloroflexota bacterium]
MAFLAQPLELAGLHLRNRLVMLPMVTNLAQPDSTVSEATIAHYGARAAREVGMVIVEATAVAQDARNIARGLGAWDDDHVPGLARLANRIKAGGAAAALQLFHSGARSVAGLPAVSPSGVSLRPGAPPRVLAEEELPAIVAQFAAAARRAVVAGFDAIEVHAAHMYLLSEFLSPFSNHRQDHYGGDVARRARLVEEVVRVVRREAGPSFPVLLRMHGEERVQGGMTHQDVLDTAERLAEAGVDAFDVSAINTAQLVEKGGYSYWSTKPYLTKDDPPGAALGNAAAIRQATGVPVIAVGKMGLPEVAERALATCQADLVGVARGFLCDPGLALKLLEGRGEDIIRCDECFVCLDLVVTQHKSIRCSQNRSLGRLAATAEAAKS